jgi:hypothetical protein
MEMAALVRVSWCKGNTEWKSNLQQLQWAQYWSDVGKKLIQVIVHEPKNSPPQLYKLQKQPLHIIFLHICMTEWALMTTSVNKGSAKWNLQIL